MRQTHYYLKQIQPHGDFAQDAESNHMRTVLHCACMNCIALQQIILREREGKVSP